MKESKTKKNITTAVLSVVIILFAALVWVSMGHMNKSEQDHLIAEETSENNTIENIELYIPKLQAATIKEPEHEAGTEMAETVEAVEAAAGEESVEQKETLEIEAEQLQDIENTVIEQKKPQEKELTTTNQGKAVVQSKPSEGKPRTAAEAVPPETPPIATETGVQDADNLDNDNKIPDSTPIPAKPVDKTPQSGVRNEKGDIYVPGFGWVQHSGIENSQEEVHLELSGILVGDM